jgi:hypothetical protein
MSRKDIVAGLKDTRKYLEERKDLFERMILALENEETGDVNEAAVVGNEETGVGNENASMAGVNDGVEEENIAGDGADKEDEVADEEEEYDEEEEDMETDA